MNAPIVFCTHLSALHIGEASSKNISMQKGGSSRTRHISSSVVPLMTHVPEYAVMLSAALAEQKAWTRYEMSITATDIYTHIKWWTGGRQALTGLDMIGNL